MRKSSPMRVKVQHYWGDPQRAVLLPVQFTFTRFGHQNYFVKFIYTLL